MSYLHIILNNMQMYEEFLSSIVIIIILLSPQKYKSTFPQTGVDSQSQHSPLADDFTEHNIAWLWCIFAN